jgi:hypothetical protein
MHLVETERGITRQAEMPFVRGSRNPLVYSCLNNWRTEELLRTGVGLVCGHETRRRAIRLRVIAAVSAEGDPKPAVENAAAKPS